MISNNNSIITLSKNIIKNTKFYLTIISTLMSSYLIWLLLSDFNKGFHLTDESYYLNLYSNPLFENFPFSYFHYIGSILFIIAQKNILVLRYIGYLILFFSVILFCYALFKSQFMSKKGDLINYLLILISIISINNYYGIYLFTPSYNLFNISLILIVTSLSFLRFYCLKSDNLIFNFTFTATFFLLIINKFSSAFLIFIILFIFFYKNISKKFLVHCFISSLLLSLTFLYFEYEKIKLVINYLFFDENYKIINHHNSSIIIKEFSDLISRIISSNFKFYLIIFLVCSIKMKSNLNIFFIFFIFIVFFAFNKNGGGLSISTVYLFFYNLALYFFFKKKIFLKNSIYLFSAYYLCIVFWFGSNNEMSRYINISSLFLYISYYLLLVNNLETHDEKKNVLTCFLFFILVFVNLYKVTIHHKKIDYSYREHINKNNIVLNANYSSKSLKDLKVRAEFQTFLKNYTKILLDNKWKEGNYIIDATLKNPGLIFLADAKYLFKGWYGHNLDVLKIALETMDKNIKPWIILSKNSNIQKIVMNNFYPFDENFSLIGTIKDPVNSRQYKIYKPNLNDSD